MTINEAMQAASAEYDADVQRAESSSAFRKLMERTMRTEYAELDLELPTYVAEIAKGMGVAPGTRLPDYVYQIARMAFRFGMRTQRKLDRPNEPTTALWRNHNQT